VKNSIFRRIEIPRLASHRCVIVIGVGTHLQFPAFAYIMSSTMPTIDIGADGALEAKT
jgi:hypothetical protein